MLRMFLRFVSPDCVQPIEVKTQSHQVVVAKRPVPQCHRDRLLSMRLEHTRICSQFRCNMLREVGIVRAGDLLTCDLKKLQANHVPAKVTRLVKRYRQVVRLAASVPGMMPRNAQLLISVHRRSVQGIASESPSALHRDLVRFSLSSKGRRLVRGRRLPSVRRLRKYISTCKTAIASTHVLVANQNGASAAAGIAFARSI